MNVQEIIERSQLVRKIFDYIDPIPEGADRETRERINRERQGFIKEAGWGSMPLEELRRLVSEEG